MDCAVIFDLDETLFDRRGSLRIFLADQLSRLTPGLWQNADGTINDFLELDRRGQTPKLDVYKTLLIEAGIDDEALAIALFADYEHSAWRFARAFDGMEEMFAEFGRLGIKTGIVSNGQTHIQLRSLLALNLDRLVDTYLISESEDLRKPEAEIFRRAAGKLAIAPERCIFVGDNPEADIEAARQVGMKTIWFPNGAVWPADLTQRPDAVVHSLKEVCAVVQHWTTGS